jgi:hypothetical protein
VALRAGAGIRRAGGRDRVREAEVEEGASLRLRTIVCYGGGVKAVVMVSRETGA